MTAESSSVSLTGSDVTIIPVDQEHAGIRLLIPILAVAGIIAGFILGVGLINAIDESISGVCGGIPMAAIMAAIFLSVTENFIKPRWPSGRHLELSQDALTVIDKRRGRQLRQTFHWSQPLHVSGWYFEVPSRRGRVPKGWYCVSVHLLQEEKEAIVYTFMDANEARQIKRWDAGFTQLISEKRSAPNTHHRPAQGARQTALYKKLKAYEQERWLDGAEISPTAFQEITNLLNTYGTYQPT
jgi:hypothetical protein